MRSKFVIIAFVTAAFAAGIHCSKEETTNMEPVTYTKVPPQEWRKLEAVRDSYKPMPDLETVYQSYRHENGLPYHLCVPDSLDAGEAYPLVVFLHGRTDLDINVHKGFPKGVWILPHIQRRYPHFVFVPRHRTEEDDWTDPNYRTMVIDAIDDLISRFDGRENTPKIDPNRVYLTGFSQGGMGTWNYIRHYPNKFAAASPLSGFFQGPQTQEEARDIAHIPIWIFNGSEDEGVDGSRASFLALKAAGARDVRYYEFVDHKHVIDDIAYFTDGFMEWLFDQERQN